MGNQMVKEHTLLLMGIGFGGEWKDGKPWNLHNIRQKRKHHRKVDEWSVTEMNSIKPTPPPSVNKSN